MRVMRVVELRITSGREVQGRPGPTPSEGTPRGAGGGPSLNCGRAHLETFSEQISTLGRTAPSIIACTLNRTLTKTLIPLV
ncbi:hypothetical protein GCM10010176_098050 [Nonomuraea spiralis]|nr:hypothetical protein GCM10010176_098050 [Nonomuraea spiralis]